VPARTKSGSSHRQLVDQRQRELGIHGDPQFNQILEAAHQRQEAFKRTFF
jgi:hypothetical protein